MSMNHRKAPHGGGLRYETRSAYGWVERDTITVAVTDGHCPTGDLILALQQEYTGPGKKSKPQTNKTNRQLSSQKQFGVFRNLNKVCTSVPSPANSDPC